MDFKYNYIIAGGSGFYEVAYSDLYNLPNVVYFKNYIDSINSKIKHLLIRINFNLKLNDFIKTPFSKLVYPWLFPHSFKEDRPLCFIFFGTQFAIINTSYLDYLRKRYPNVKLVLYMQDIVASLPYYDIKSYKKNFDIVLSYDKGDCEKYNLVYFPTPFSKIDIDKLPKVDEDMDVYFCGAGKTRYPEIFKAYVKCKNQGLKCKFFLMGVPLDKRIDGEGLVYDKRISYEMNLAYAAKSKCILEIMQENADGYTPRLWEAIMLNKHLLTNNSAIKYGEYKKLDSIHLIDECSSLDFINDDVSCSKEIKEKKSPINLLLKIDSL